MGKTRRETANAYPCCTQRCTRRANRLAKCQQTWRRANRLGSAPTDLATDLAVSCAELRLTILPSSNSRKPRTSHAYTECRHVAQCFALINPSAAQHDRLRHARTDACPVSCERRNRPGGLCEVGVSTLTHTSPTTPRRVAKSGRRENKTGRRENTTTTSRRLLECRTFFPKAA